MVTVLREILEWSRGKGRPDWQRDALRRLVVVGELSDEDLQSLAEICKAGYGLAEPREVLPLAPEHVPDEGGAGTSVSLDSVFHHRGVNALAENQTLRFSPGLTVVYGDNAAGKTGYIRILKAACRARAQEEILGNVVSGAAPPAPDIAIKYTLGRDPEAREWTWQEEDEFISRVSVFDSRSAAVYLTEKTNVAFRPFGLDLFDKLVRACNAIRDQLSAEQRALASNELAHLKERVPEGTAVATLLANINVLTKPEQVSELSRLSPEHGARLSLLERSLLDLRANDPEKLRQELVVRARRVAALAEHVCALESALSQESVHAVFALREEGRRKLDEATRLREVAFPEDVLPGTGTRSWSSLWQSAREFSEELAYPGSRFPRLGTARGASFASRISTTPPVIVSKRSRRSSIRPRSTSSGKHETPWPSDRVRSPKSRSFRSSSRRPLPRFELSTRFSPTPSPLPSLWPRTAAPQSISPCVRTVILPRIVRTSWPSQPTSGLSRLSSWIGPKRFEQGPIPRFKGA